MVCWGAHRVAAWAAWALVCVVLVAWWGLYHGGGGGVKGGVLLGYLLRASFGTLLIRIDYSAKVKSIRRACGRPSMPACVGRCFLLVAWGVVFLCIDTGGG